jgi:hypothetical protein
LVQRLRAHLGLRIQLDQAVTETFQRYRRLVHQFRRHQLDEIRTDQFAAGSLDKLALAGQGRQVLRIEDRGEFPFDFAGIAGHVVVHLHRDAS